MIAGKPNWQWVAGLAAGYFVLNLMVKKLIFGTDLSAVRLIGTGVTALVFGFFMTWLLPRISK